MHTPEQDDIALRSQYGDLYNEIVQPERKYAISHYLRTQWAPRLGAARFWFVIALRQRCYWNNKQDWCIVDKRTLARESGLSLRTVNRIVAAADLEAADEARNAAGGDRDTLAAWFFAKTQRRRYNQYVGRTVNAPNRYHVLLDDPLTPDHQLALAHHLHAALTDRSPEGTLAVLRTLCDRAEQEWGGIVPPPDEVQAAVPLAAGEMLHAAFVLDVVEAHCPMPDPKDALYVEIARAASRLHNAITRPERVYVGNQYFRLQWVPVLGPVLSSLVVQLRARCYWNAHTGELRDTCSASWAELAGEIGCTARQLRNLRQAADLDMFVALLREGHGQARSRFRVSMADPLTPNNQKQFERQAHGGAGLLLDPETGQIDAYALLVKGEILAPGGAGRTTHAEVLALGSAEHPPHAEIPAPGTGTAAANAEGLARTEDTQTETLAPGSAAQAEVLACRTVGQAEALAPGCETQPEILAPGGRKFWHIEGLQAEVLASEPGNSGTTYQILLITPTQKGLTETALPVSAGQAEGTERLAAALRTILLTEIGIQQPNRERLLERHPRCDWIVGWALYALSQPGLSNNKPGYVYNRLWAEDPPPSDMLELAGLSPPHWRDLCEVQWPGDVRTLPPSIQGIAETWLRSFVPLCDVLLIQIDAPGDRDGTDRLDLGPSTADAAGLPDELRGLLVEQDLVEPVAGGWEIATGDLYQAYRVARWVRAHGWVSSIAVLYLDARGGETVLNAEILALDAAPLAEGVWEAFLSELSWVISRTMYERLWRDVLPLGEVTGAPDARAEGDRPSVVLCAPTAAVRDWLVTHHLPIAQRTLSEVMGHVVRVQVLVYGQVEPVPSPA